MLVYYSDHDRNPKTATRSEKCQRFQRSFRVALAALVLENFDRSRYQDREINGKLLSSTIYGASVTTNNTSEMVKSKKPR